MAMNPGYGQFGGAPPPQQMGGPPPGQNFGAPPLAGAGVTYEFNDFENQAIAKVGSRAKLAGTIAIVFGAFGLLGAVFAVVGLIIGASTGSGVAAVGPMIALTTVLPVAIVNLVVGFSYRNAGRSLVDVTLTQGNDVQHMMASLQAFKKAFQLETIMGAVAMTLGFVAGFVIGVLR